ncbi:MAG: polysaccharide deacetylase family protein [Bryobacteraceae bacterium]
MASRSFLKMLKLLALHTAQVSKISRLVLNSEWRRKRLLILCYHAATTGDEHRCFPGFYMPVEMFRQRLEFLRQWNVRVLPLAEALERLYAGTLPRRSAVITLDDAFYAAYKYCRPLLKEYGFPSTVYVTTYYVAFNRPPFDIMCRYLLWKTHQRKLDWPEILAGPATLDEGGRASCGREIFGFSERNKMGGREKDDLLAELAGRLGIDYRQLCRDRVLHLANPEEIRLWAREADLQLHTHRHRVSRQQETMYQELRDNITALEQMIGGSRRHLAYPGGACIPEYSTWLSQFGLQSAASCETGLASAASDPMLLPRVMETAHNTPLEVAGWITGVNAFLPVRGVGGQPELEAYFI